MVSVFTLEEQCHELILSVEHPNLGFRCRDATDWKRFLLSEIEEFNLFLNVNLSDKHLERVLRNKISYRKKGQ